MAVQQRSCRWNSGEEQSGSCSEKNTVALQVEQQYRIEEAAAGAAAFE